MDKNQRMKPIRSMPEVIGDVAEEVMKATKKHPAWPKDDFRALAIVHEELGETDKENLHVHYENGDRQKVYEEMVQTACTAIRFLMNYDKRTQK